MRTFLVAGLRASAGACRRSPKALARRGGRGTPRTAPQRDRRGQPRPRWRALLEHVEDAPLDRSLHHSEGDEASTTRTRSRHCYEDNLSNKLARARSEWAAPR